MVAEGALSVLEACETIVQDAEATVDLGPWRDLIVKAMAKQGGDAPAKEEDEEQYVKVEREGEEAGHPEEAAGGRFHNGVLTIGMVGQPNAGKSSLINSLIGKRVVSVSKTPGHTKHFQTIFVTGNVKLCDCPGLVFPSLVPKPLQVLMGSYPISQV